LAHTAWFFESFILREFVAGYRVFNEDFAWLFNSYYRSFAAYPEKRLRASFSRPGLDEVLGYRKHVDDAVQRLLEQLPGGDAGAEEVRRIELGVNHEEQHQELLLTDILHGFFTNPLRPVYRGEGDLSIPMSQNPDLAHPDRRGRVDFAEFDGGLREVGHGGEGFCFDNELPRHRVWLEPYALASRLVTCGEFAEFMADGGYQRPELWLSAGWDAVEANGWRAPLYWTPEGSEKDDGGWRVFTLRGELALERVKDAPVSQVSYFEADAYARWAGHRLATEFEWEAAAADFSQDRQVARNLLDSRELRPVAAEEGGGPTQLFGDCWEWTGSAYLGYPGFQALAGSLGEYNGKFMSGQMVLRGGSCVTPERHIRGSYRNFFSPETRWQFSGIRLARKLSVNRSNFRGTGRIQQTA
jgi:ergothioneine biosynthesis protein EgtB